LIAKGCDVSLKDSQGFTASDIAHIHEHYDFINEIKLFESKKEPIELEIVHQESQQQNQTNQAVYKFVRNESLNTNQETVDSKQKSVLSINIDHSVVVNANLSESPKFQINDTNSKSNY
jgi:hypothetical protein